MKTFTEVNDKIKSYPHLIDLLEKNKNVNHLGEYRKCISVLKTHQEELEKISTLMNKDYTKEFKDSETHRAELLENLKKVKDLLKIYVSSSKGKDKSGFLNESLENISDKQLLKITQKTISLAYKVGSYSVTSFKKVSPKKIHKRIANATLLSSNFGLTPEMVNELDNSAFAFMKSMAQKIEITEERQDVLKYAEKLIDKNEKIISNKINPFLNVYENPGSSFMADYNQIRHQTTIPEEVNA